MYPGYHAPLVPPELFDRVQEILMSRRRRVTRRGSRLLLAALARCASYSSLITADEHGPYTYYRCCGSARSQNRCRAPYTRLDTAHQQLETIYQRIVLAATFKRRLLRLVTEDSVEAMADRYRSHRGIRLELADCRQSHFMKQCRSNVSLLRKRQGDMCVPYRFGVLEQSTNTGQGRIVIRTAVETSHQI